MFVYFAMQQIVKLGHSKGLSSDTSAFELSSTSSYIGFIASSLLGAAFLDELFFRGYLIDRFEALFAISGRPRVTSALAVLASCVWFGAWHEYEGPAAVLAAAFAGISFGLRFLVSGRSLFAAMIVHALVDVIAVSAMHSSVDVFSIDVEPWSLG